MKALCVIFSRTELCFNEHNMSFETSSIINNLSKIEVYQDPLENLGFL